MMQNFADLIKYVQSGAEIKKVVVAAAADLHTLEGAYTAYKNGVVKPILVGDQKAITAICKEHGFDFGDSEIVDEPDVLQAAKKAVQLVSEGKGNFLMKGKLQTAELLHEVVNKEYGLKTGSVMSHVGLFEIPGYHKLVVITDGGMLIAPNVEQKEKIVNNAVDVLRMFGYDTPKVAALCATEVVNPKMQESVDAGQLKEWNQSGRIQNCIVEGPISYDLTMSKESAEIKGYESPITGEADVLLCPNMTTGNLLAKAIMFHAGAKMAGIIVGAKVPIVLVSRGASSEEKYLSLVFAAAASK